MSLKTSRLSFSSHEVINETYTTDINLFPLFSQSHINIRPMLIVVEQQFLNRMYWIFKLINFINFKKKTTIVYQSDY